MTVLMALIIVLLIAIVLWMGTMSILYTIQNEALNEASEMVKKYVEIVNKVADQLAENQRFNLDTIQQARRIVNEVRKATPKNPEPFVYIEKENPEEPRS